MKEDRCSVRFPYLKGKTLSETLGEDIQSGKAPMKAIRAALDKIYDVNPEFLVPFQVTPEFLEVFGELEGVEALQGDSYQISNVDGLFENMMETEDGLYCLDYEWVFSFPIPVSFVQFRTLMYFYLQYHSLMNDDSLETFLEEFDITAERADLYQQMEKRFQQYVHGNNQKIYLENFIVQTKTVKDLAQMDVELKIARERLEQLKLQIGERTLPSGKFRKSSV